MVFIKFIRVYAGNIKVHFIALCVIHHNKYNNVNHTHKYIHPRLCFINVIRCHFLLFFPLQYALYYELDALPRMSHPITIIIVVLCNIFVFFTGICTLFANDKFGKLEFWTWCTCVRKNRPLIASLLRLYLSVHQLWQFCHITNSLIKNPIPCWDLCRAFWILVNL